MHETTQDETQAGQAAAEEVYTFPLSYAQRRLWLLAQIETESPAYHIASGLRIRGPLRPEVLERALDEIVARHEALRTTFAVVDGEPAQMVSPGARVPLARRDLSALPEGDREAALRAEAAAEARRPFDLARGPLLRLVLVKAAERDHVLLCTFHHLVSDGWSETVFQDELTALYAAYAAGAESPLAELPIQYGDYAVWEKETLEGGREAELVAFWKQALDGAPPVLELPADRPRPAEPTYAGALATFTVDPATAAGLRALTVAEGTTLYATLLAAYGVLLARRAGATEVLVGSPVANRGQVELEGLIGLFLNPVVMRVDLAGDPTFRELVGRVRETALSAFEHADLPFEALVEALAPARDRSRNPYFQVFFNLENTPPAGPAASGEVTWEPFHVDVGSAKLDLVLNMRDAGGALQGSVEYATDLYDAATVRRIVASLGALLADAAANPDRPVSALALVPEEEAALLAAWSAAPAAPAVPEAPFQALHEAFAARAAADPEAVAVEARGRALTFRELDDASGRLAGHLRSLGVRRGDVVAVLLQRTPELAVAVLGALKAGAAYLPVDADAPAERVAWMLEDAGARAVVTTGAQAGYLPRGRFPVVRVDADAAALAAAEAAPPTAVAPDDLAYVIYTSGSTGRPKGVMVPHDAAAAYLAWCRAAYPAGAAPLHGPVAFDMSVTTLFAPWLSGHAVVMVPDGEGVEELAAALSSGRRFGFVKLTPSHLELLNRTLAPEAMAAAGALVVGGEALFAETLAPWREHAPDTRIFNEYGPTEATVGCVVHEAATGDAAAGAVAIGRPLPGSRAYLLDAHLRPVPAGVHGELYLGGAQVARGYLGRAALTAERFLPDPFAAEPGARMYRSGDRARHRADGALEYLGRADFQVKVRGYRIEPGEVEAALVEHPDVREAVVVARAGEGGERRLVAYHVAARVITVDELRAFLAPRLPDYMVPAAFVALDALPLTPHGKVDRAALPDPEAARPALDDAYEAPRTLAEETLASIWARVLGVESVGVNDNFFALGGDSIRSLMAAGLARERGLAVSIRQIARHPTIAELAAQVQQAQAGAESEFWTEPFSLVSDEDRARLPDDVVDAYPLARMQLGMLYHREKTPDAPLFHSINSHHVRMPLDEALFQRATTLIAERHPNLRTSFDLAGYSEPLQLVHREAHFPVHFHDLRALDAAGQDAALAAFWQAEIDAPFDLARAPQLRFHIHRRTDDSFQYTLTENHAIVDGWSLHTMFEEILAVYLGLLKTGEVPELPPLRTTYRDFVATERKALESEEARAFWTDRLAGYVVPPLPEIPGHEADPEKLRVWRLDRLLPPQLVGDLRRLARQEAVPLKSVFLAAHLRVMSIFLGRTDLVTGMSTNGRLETSDSERVGGLFLNTLPFRATLPGGSWSDLIHRTYEAEMQVMPHRRYPLSAIQGRWGTETLFDTSFVYLNFHILGQHRDRDMGYVEASAMVEETNFAVMTAFQHQPGNMRRIALSLCCDRWKLTDRQIRDLADWYFATLRAMVEAPEARYEGWTPYREEERLALVAGSAEAAAEEEAEPVHRRFEAAARRSPEREAVRSEGRVLTYAEADAAANRVANRLREVGAGPEARVAVLAERATEAVVAILGTMKSGAAYVPLDPAWPDERIARILADAAPAAVVVLERLRERLGGFAGAVVAADGPEVAGASAASPGVEVHPASLAYVVYTSGTTGTPKGVAVEHRQLAAYVGRAAERLGLPADASYALVSTLAADLGNTMLFPALTAGGTLHVISEARAADAAAFAEYVEAHGIDCLKIVPSHLEALLAHAEPAAVLPRLRLVLGGEAAGWELVDRVHELAPGCRVFNHYGPTETTVGVVAGELLAGAVDPTAAPPLGRALGHARAYVLDAHFLPAPVGTAGELFVGGPAVARGYLGSPGRSAAVFLPDPFAPAAGGRMYRTGDRARLLPDGRLEFLGRADEQVKVRGYRVELREVETALAAHPEVAACAVAARRDDGDVRLAGYVVAREGAGFSEEGLRAFLSARLPAYMVPPRIVTLAALPLTPNGKLDRAALPAPDAPAADALPVAPRSATEAALVEIWKGVLKQEEVGVYDDFFALGGDSIKAILASARIRKAFGVTLPAAALFGARTAAALAGEVEMALQQASRGAEPIEPAPRDGDLPLSSAQHRLWFNQLLDTEAPTHNVAYAFRLRGALDAGAWRRALDEVVRRHEALRTVFPSTDGEPRQVIHPAGPAALRELDLSHLAEGAREQELDRLVKEEAWRPFDLERGPLFRALLVRSAEHDHGVVLAVHHIVFDGWSVGVLMGELSALYEAFRDGLPSPLPEPRLQYADFAVWQRAHLGGEVEERQTGYWKARLAGAPPLEVPADHPRGEVRAYRGGTEHAGFGRAESEAIRALAQGEGVTLFMALLAGWAALLAHRSGQDDFVVGSPLATNRDRPELEGLIGLFLNTLGLRVDLAGNPTFRDLLARVRTTALEAYANQDVPFDRVVEALGTPREAGRSPVFQVWYNHSNVEREKIRFGGLALAPLDVGDGAVKFDLMLATEEAGGRLLATLHYDRDLFERETAWEVLAQLQALLRHAAARPELTLAELGARVAEEAGQARARRRGERDEARRGELRAARRRGVAIEA